MIGSGGACLLALIPALVYHYQNQLPPPTPHVLEVPPENNAFDLISQAVAALPPVPPRTIAVSAPLGMPQLTGFDDGFLGTHPKAPRPYTTRYNKVFPLSKKVAYLKASQSALALWRQSLDLPLYVPDDIEESEQTLARLWRSRGSAIQSALIQARACWQRGDSASALNWLLDIHHSYCRDATSFYNHQSHSRDYGALYWSARKRVAIDTELVQLMPHLNASQLRQATRELERNRIFLSSISDAFKVTQKQRMARIYRWCERNDLRLIANATHPERSDIGTAEQMRFRWTNKKRALELLEKQSDWLIAQAKVPVLQRATEYPDGLDLKDDDPLRRMMFYNIVFGFVEIDKAEAQEIVLITAMAVRAFELEQGHPPRNLNELMPKYLKKIENDPFNPTHQLRYSPKSKTYRQWYIGGPIYTKKMPHNAIAVPALAYAPGSKQPTGYLVMEQMQHLPFLLYSVGQYGQDEGGINFKGAGVKPNLMQAGPSGGYDDIVALPGWFEKSDLPESYHATWEGISPLAS